MRSNFTEQYEMQSVKTLCIFFVVAKKQYGVDETRRK